MSFWANKLNGQAPTAQPITRELYPTTPLYTPQASQPQAVPMESYTPTVRLTQGSTCPGCGSTNYRGTVGERAISCPECGYHPRFEQSGYGERSLRTAPGDATPARQISGGQTMQGALAVLKSGYRDNSNSL